MIEIHRPVYKHWVIYVGDGHVVHVTTTGKDELFVKHQLYVRRGNKKQLMALLISICFPLNHNISDLHSLSKGMWTASVNYSVVTLS